MLLYSLNTKATNLQRLNRLRYFLNKKDWKKKGTIEQSNVEAKKSFGEIS